MKTNRTLFSRENLKTALATTLCVSGLTLGSALLVDNMASAGNGGFTERAPQTSMQGGGFTGPGLAVSTVAEAKTMRDDAKVVLRGQIKQHLGGDDYLFQDSTGTIRADIDDHKWRGQSVTPEDVVELHGEVDKDWNSVEIDVDRIVKTTTK